MVLTIKSRLRPDAPCALSLCIALHGPAEVSRTVHVILDKRVSVAAIWKNFIACLSLSYYPYGQGSANTRTWPTFAVIIVIVAYQSTLPRRRAFTDSKAALPLGRYTASATV